MLIDEIFRIGDKPYQKNFETQNIHVPKIIAKMYSSWIDGFRLFFFLRLGIWSVN